jgi:hypothetical protein
MAVENTAVNDLIERVLGGSRPTFSVPLPPAEPVMASSEQPLAQFPATMPVAAPFETRQPALPPYPVAVRSPAGMAQWTGAEGAPLQASGFPPHELVDPRDRERFVPTFRMRRRTSQMHRTAEVRGIIGRLVFPVALLMSIGVVIGAYVGFAGGHEGRPSDAPTRRATRGASVPATISQPGIAATARSSAGAISQVAALLAPAPAEVAAVSTTPADVAAAPATTAAAAVPALVDVRIDSTPSGATVMLVDRGRSQFVGSTPIDAAVDPSREYDLVFTAENQPPHVEHLDPRTMRRVAVALGEREGARAPDDPPHRARRIVGESAPRRATRAHGGSVIEDGTLMISSKPPCDILVDGRPTGLTTPQRSLTLSAGHHRITLVNSEKSIRKTVVVQIAAHATEKIVEDLMK